jgi:hypothetical protein
MALAAVKPRAVIAVGVLACVAAATLLWQTPPRAAQTLAESASTQAPAPVTIQHEPPTNPAHQAAFSRIQGDATLETARRFFEAFRLPQPLTLRTRSCGGRGGAWYREGVITVCYEYLQTAHDNAVSERRPDWVSVDGAIKGAIADVFLHEGAHALFELYRTPLMGREEDAADMFATFAILNLYGEAGPAMIRGVAYSYLVDAQARTFSDLPTLEARALPSRIYGGPHSTPLQRMYSVVCHASGFDTQAYRDLVTMSDLPNWRASGCVEEYGQIAHAFRTLLAPHLDPGRLAALGTAATRIAAD